MTVSTNSKGPMSIHTSSHLKGLFGSAVAFGFLEAALKAVTSKNSRSCTLYLRLEEISVSRGYKDNIVRFPTTEISCVIYFTFFRDRFFYLVQIKFELGGGKKLKALWCRNEN